jgi:hypothetical protein
VEYGIIDKVVQPSDAVAVSYIRRFQASFFLQRVGFAPFAVFRAVFQQS